MKLKEIGASVFETTTAGGIAAVASSLFTPTADGQPAMIRRTKKKKDKNPSIYEGDMEADREAGIKWVDNPEWEQLHNMDLDMVKDFLEHKESVSEKHPDAGVPLSVRRARKKKSKKQMKYDMQHAKHLSKTNNEFTGHPDNPYAYKGDGNARLTGEAVGDAAKPLYDLQDELGLEDNVLVDELARYLDVDQIADFVADFRRHHGIGEGDGRKRGIHPKGHPKRKAQQAAIHAEGKK